MLKEKLFILDSLFSHTQSTSLGNVPSNFDWVWSVNEDLIIMTDSHVDSVGSIKSKRKIAWLIESPLIMGKSYNFVKNNSDKFEKIFTFSREILETTSNSELVPIGGCWISENQRVIHPKNKNVSIISSQKNYLQGHILRHNVIKNTTGVDVYGRGYNEISNKIIGLKDYKFSIVIENAKVDYYFTEKLIDCFITGTIPIYWGCPSIGDFFDINGIITFDTVDELNVILNSIDGEYEKRIKSIKTNYELSKKYLIADDIIYEKLKN